MYEVITEAIVLDKEDLGEYDSRIFLYTKNFGKIISKATSVRKITSKLASHLEPLNYITARLVSRRDGILNGRGFQLIDALAVERRAGIRDNDEKLRNALQVVHFISRAVPEGVMDSNLWNFLYGISAKAGDSSIRDTLEFLGFSPDFASCELCSGSGPEYFYPKDSMFICHKCISKSQELRMEFIKV